MLKSTSGVATVGHVGAGAAEKLQYRLAYAMACSGEIGQPHSGMSSVVCALLTSVVAPRQRTVQRLGTGCGDR